MRAVVQRVTDATVVVGDLTVGSIKSGLVVYVGISHDDGVADVNYVVGKVLGLRVFTDQAGKMNLSIVDLKDVRNSSALGILAISQFTLYGDVRKGRRPSYNEAAPPEYARPLFDQVVDGLQVSGLRIATGEFGAHMDVKYVNDGPVTILIDSKKEF